MDLKKFFLIIKKKKNNYWCVCFPDSLVRAECFGVKRCMRALVALPTQAAAQGHHQSRLCQLPLTPRVPACDQTNTRVAPEWQHLLVFLSHMGWGCGTPFTGRGHPSSAPSAVVGLNQALSGQQFQMATYSELHTQSLSCVRLFGDPINCSPSGYPVHGIFQARILKWVAIFSSRRSSQPRDGTRVCCIGRRILHC